MKVVFDSKQLSGMHPVFGDDQAVYYVEKGYSQYSSNFYRLELETGTLHDVTPLIMKVIRKCIEHGRVLDYNYNKSASQVVLPLGVVLWTNRKDDDPTVLDLYRDTGDFAIHFNPEPYLRVNKRIVEALALVLTGKIDGDQFVKGILAAGQGFGLSENQLSLVRSSKITKIYTGGIKIEAETRIVRPSELYLLR